MNYLDTLKQQYPEIGKYSDDEILSVLPELNPALASMSPEQIHAFATTDAPSSLWDIAKSGYQSVIGNREIAGAVSDIKDLNNPEFADVAAAQPRGNSMMGVSADELRRRSKAATGQEDVLISEAQSRLDSGNERLRKAGEVTLSPTTERFLTGGDSDRSWWEDFAADPITIISEIGAQSAYGSAEALGTGLLGSAAGPVGFAVGGGLGSGRIEFANTVVDELKKAGVDVTDARAVHDALSEKPDLYQHAASQGLKRATAIGALDAATMGLASKSLGVGQGLTRQATNLLAQGVVQTGGGAAGEAMAQLATEGAITDTRAVAAEAVGELVTAPVDVLAATRDPMGAAQRRIEQAGEDTAAQGGDALDQEIAKAKTAVDEIPKAAAAEKEVQTAADLGVEFPQSEPLTEEPQARQSRAERMAGIDGMILTAERMGFTDEEALLRRAKQLYQQADQARASGNDRMASLYVDGGNRLYRSATEAQEPLRTESADFPVPYAFDGQVEGGDLAPFTGPQGPGAIDGETLTQPPRTGRDARSELGYSPSQRLTDQGIIYGDEPADVRAAREQRQADTFNAFYGQEGRQPGIAPLEGDYVPRGRITEQDRLLEDQRQPVGLLQQNSAPQLPPGTGQMDMGRDRPQRTFTPAGPVTEGIGRNVVERQAQMAPGLPQGNAARTITPDQFRQMQQLRREGLRTKVRERTPEQVEAIQAVAAVQAGEIEVSETPAATPGAAPGIAESTPNIAPVTEPNADMEAKIKANMHARIDIAGEPIDSEWTAFAPESGTLDVPRAQMPQVKAEHRGALVNYLNARGIEHEQAEIDPRALKATQREFSPAKVQKAREYQGGERSILVSSDGHVVDGHHQWLARRETGEPMRVIQFQAPIRDLVPLLHDFPSSGVDAGATLGATIEVNEAPVGEAQADLSVTSETQVTEQPAEPAQEAGEEADKPTQSNDRQMTEAAQDAATEQKAAPETKSAKIEDFGEVLEGARKHTATFRQAMDADVDVREAPLSKSFPQPDYEKLAAAGVEPRALAFIAQLRGEIKVKPRKSYKLGRWADDVESARWAVNALLKGEITPDALVERMEARGGYMKHMPTVLDIATEILPSQIKDLGRFKLSEAHYSIYRGEKNVDKFVVTDTGTKAGFGGMGNQEAFDTLDEAAAFIKSRVTSVDGQGKPQTKFDIYSYRGEPGVHIGKKVAARKYIDLKKFDSAAEARKYLSEHNEELTQLLAEKKKVRAVRRTDNEPRVGEDYREGRDVTPEEFGETFGFRGVQFGNWVENDKRQQDLNQAYDSLMDLAGIVGVPPKALSLNGELGLAFGARGKGGKDAAAAHYEPGTVVINLTKKQGAGSLAHEWWHAVDNYFGRMDKAEYLTEAKRPARKIVNKDGRNKSVPTSSEDFAVRQEVYDAFKAVEQAITKETQMARRSTVLDKTRTKDYWSTVREMTARTFERYVIGKLEGQDSSNDYLANIVSEQDHAKINEALGVDEPYAYPLESEMDAVNRAYDQLFDTLETRKTDSGVALYSRSTQARPAIPREEVDRLARDIMRGWKNAPDTVVVSDESGLPADLQQYIEEDGASGQIDGVFHRGKVFLIADNIKSEADVQRILFHEALGHYGLRQLYGPALELHLDRLWKQIGGLEGVRNLERRYGFNLGQYWDSAETWSPEQRRQMMADELIAHIAGTGKVEPTLLQKITHIIRQGLRKLFGDTKLGAALDRMTDVELLRIVAAARDAVVEGESTVSYATHDPVFVSMFYRSMYDRTDTNESGDTRYSRTTTADQFDDLNKDQTSFLNKIGPKTARQKLRDRVSDTMDNIGLKTRQGLVDRYASLLELDKKAQGEDVVENRTRFSSWVLSKMSHAADGALSAMLTHGRIQFTDGVIELKAGDQKGLMDVLKGLGSTEEIERFLGWIAANRSQSIMEKAQAARGRAEAAKAEKANLQDMLKEPGVPPGKAKAINKAIKDADAVIKRELDAAAVDERLFTPEEVEAGVKLNQGKTKAGKPRGLVYDQVFKEFQQYRDDVLAIAEQTGIITADNRSMWRDEFYVPFYRVMEEEGAKGPSISKGLSRQEAYKRLKGGSQEINDLLENTLMNFQHLLSASLKNNAARQALANAEAVGIATRTTETGRNKKSSTYVLDQGEKVWYDIEDDLVFESLSALADVGTNTMSRRIMRSFKRTFTSFTTISPQFVVANTLRDALQSIAIGNLSYNAFSNVVKGAKAYGGPNNKGRTRGDMLASGAAFSFGHIYGAGDIDALKSGIQRQIKGAKTISSPKDVAGLWRAVWDQYTGYGDTMENSNRAAIYEQNLKKGKLYAAFQSRDLMDFSSQGAWPAVKFLTDVVPFLNARLVGLDRLYRGGIKPSFNVIKHMLGGPEASMTDRQAALRFGVVVGSLTAATIALYLSNMDDDRFKELEEWERDAYWHIWVGDKHFTIPKPFEIGAIATAAERTLEQVIDDTKDGKLFAERMGHILTDTFAFNPIPQAAKPLFDLYANKDSFTGRDIESLSMLRLSPINRERATTTDPARAASWVMDKTLGKLSQDLVWSPVQVDFLIQGYLGWVGSMGASTVDVLSKTAQGVETPHKKWHEYQPIRRFFRDDSNPKSFTRYGTEFYDHLREVNMLYADIQNLRKLGEMEGVAELLQENRGTLRYRQLLNRAQRRLSAISNQIKLTQMNRSLSAEVKRQRIDVLTAQRNLLTRRVVERIEQ